MLFFTTKLTFNYDFESFFPKGDSDLAYYMNHREKFGKDNTFLLIAAENKPSVYDQTFLNQFDELTKSIKQLEHVTEVVSLTELKNELITPAGIYGVPFIHLNSPEKYTTDSSLIANYPELVNNLISRDAQHLSMMLWVDGVDSKDKNDRLIESIDSLLVNSGLKTHFSGRFKAEHIYVNRMQVELVFFIMCSMVLIVLFLYFTYRSFLGIIIPLFVIMLAVIWSLGTMAVFNKPIDIMTVLLPTIMFVVGMSDVIHLISKYIEELRTGKTKEEAIKTTIKEIGLATFFTSLTTAIGFFTLYSTGIQPVQEFGLFTGIGVFFAFIITLSLLPLILRKLPVDKLITKKENKWDSFLRRLFIWVTRNKKTISFSTIVLLIIAGVGISTIKIDVKLIDELNEGDPLKDDFIFFENTFSGVRQFDLSIKLKDTTQQLITHETLLELEDLHRYLEDSFGVQASMSPYTLVCAINRSINGGNPDYYSLPNPKELKKQQRILKRAAKSDKLAFYISKDLKEGRLFGRMGDIGSNLVKTRLEAFNLYKNKYTHLDLKATGSALLIDKSNDNLSTNMLQGLGIAFVIVAIIMGFLYKSIRIILISFIPNIIPLVVIGGLLGFTGIGLKISTAIIFTIAFGIAVDDTIHFMSKLKIELNKGKSKIYALKRTFISTGKAIIQTSLVLSSGFLLLIFSNFNGTYYTGLLVSITLIVAVVADLLLIPVLIVYFYKPNK